MMVPGRERGTNPMTVVEAMKNEHGSMLRELNQAGPTASMDVNEAFLGHLTDHFAQEERELYPMAQAAGWTGGSAVTELRYQHQTLRQNFKESVQNRESWERFGQQVREHFSAEELLVFPLVEGQG